jgi:hypothetical protein
LLGRHYPKILVGIGNDPDFPNSYIIIDAQIWGAYSQFTSLMC